MKAHPQERVQKPIPPEEVARRRYEYLEDQRFRNAIPKRKESKAAYQRRWRAARRPSQVWTCLGCGAEFPRVRVSHHGGRQATRCDGCCNAWELARRRRTGAILRIPAGVVDGAAG